MLKTQHPTDYLKKEVVNLKADHPLKEEQSIKQKDLEQRHNLRRFKRSVDNPDLPDNFEISSAIGGGDCFFDSVAQGLKQLKPEMDFTVKSLREVCKRFAQSQLSIGGSWLKEALKNENEQINEYIPRIEFTANDIEQQSEVASVLGLTSPMWGRTEIEGRIICKEYGVKLHIIEKHTVQGKEIWTDQIVDESGSRSIDDIDYSEDNTIHVVNKGRLHFEPILNKARVRKTVQQENRLSPLDNRQPKSDQQQEHENSGQVSNPLEQLKAQYQATEIEGQPSGSSGSRKKRSDSNHQSESSNQEEQNPEQVQQSTEKLFKDYLFKKLFQPDKNAKDNPVDTVNEQRKEVIELIKKLNLNSGVHFYNADLFTFVLIAKNIHLLKRQLKQFYGELPWEEVGFHLANSVNVVLKMHQHLDLAEWYKFKHLLESEVWRSSESKSEMRRMVVEYDREIKELQEYLVPYSVDSIMRKELLESLSEFSAALEAIQFTKEDISSDLPDGSTEKILGFSESLYDNYETAKDPYSLERILHYIELALSINPNEKLGKFVIERALQVTGEYLKYTHESPHLSNISRQSLIDNGMSEEIINSLLDIRNLLSHSKSLPALMKIEKEGSSIFADVQMELKHVKDVIEKVYYDILIRKLIDRINLIDIANDDQFYCELKKKVEELKKSSNGLESIEKTAIEILKHIQGGEINDNESVKKIKELINQVVLNIKFGKVNRVQNKIYGLINEASDVAQNSKTINGNMIEKLKGKILESSEIIAKENTEKVFSNFHELLEKELITQHESIKQKLESVKQDVLELKKQMLSFFNENSNQSEEEFNRVTNQLLELKILGEEEKNKLYTYYTNSNPGGRKNGEELAKILFSKVKVFEALLKSAKIQPQYYSKSLKDIFDKFYKELNLDLIIEDYSKEQGNKPEIVAELKSKKQTSDAISKLEKSLLEQKKAITELYELFKENEKIKDKIKEFFRLFNSDEKFDEKEFKGNLLKELLGNSIKTDRLIDSHQAFINNGNSKSFQNFINQLNIPQQEEKKLNIKFSKLYSESVKRSKLVDILEENKDILGENRCAELKQVLNSIELFEKMLKILSPFAEKDKKKSKGSKKEEHKDDQIKEAIEKLNNLIDNEKFKELNDIKDLKQQLNSLKNKIGDLSTYKDEIVSKLKSLNGEAQEKIKTKGQERFVKSYNEFIKADKIDSLINSLTDSLTDDQKQSIKASITSGFEKFANANSKLGDVLQKSQIEDSTKEQIRKIGKIVEVVPTLVNHIKDYSLKNIKISEIEGNIKVQIENLISELNANCDLSDWQNKIDIIKLPDDYKKFIENYREFISIRDKESFEKLVGSLRVENRELSLGEKELLNSIFDKFNKLELDNIVDAFKEKLSEKFNKGLRDNLSIHKDVSQKILLLADFLEKKYYESSVNKLESCELKVLEGNDKKNLNDYFDSNREEGKRFIEDLGVKKLSKDYIDFMQAYNSFKKADNEETFDKLKKTISALNLDLSDKDLLNKNFLEGYKKLEFDNILQNLNTEEKTREIYNQLKEKKEVYDAVSELTIFFSKKLMSENVQPSYENHVDKLCNVLQLGDDNNVKQELKQLLNSNSPHDWKKGKLLVLQLKISLPNDYKKSIKAYKKFISARNKENFKEFYESIALASDKQEELDKALSTSYESLEFENILKGLQKKGEGEGELEKKKQVYDIIFTELVSLFEKKSNPGKKYTEQEVTIDLESQIGAIEKKVKDKVTVKEKLSKYRENENWKKYGESVKKLDAYGKLFEDIKLGKTFKDIAQHFNDLLSNLNNKEDKKLPEEDRKLLNDVFFKALVKEKEQHSKTNFKRRLSELKGILPKEQNEFSVDKKLQAAVEVVLCGLLDILVEVEPKFELERSIMHHDSIILDRTSLRNYLAHGGMFENTLLKVENVHSDASVWVFNNAHMLVEKRKLIIALKGLVEDAKMKEYLIDSDGSKIDELDSKIPKELQNVEKHINTLKKDSEFNWKFILKKVSNTLKNTSNKLGELANEIVGSKEAKLGDIIAFLGENKINDFREKLNKALVKKHENLIKNTIELSHYWISHFKYVLEERKFSTIEMNIDLPNISGDRFDEFCTRYYKKVIELELLDSLRYSNSAKIGYCLNLTPSDINDIKLGTKEYTLLHYAAKYSNLNTIDFLIKKGASVKKNHDDETPLYHAVDFRSEEDFKGIVALFQQTNVINTIKNNGDWTLLHRAARAGNLEIIKYLTSTQVGADSNARNGNGEIPLHVAAMFGHKEIVKFFIEDKRIAIGTCDKFGYTSLHHAAGGASFYKDDELLSENGRLWVDENKRLGVVKYLVSENAALMSLRTKREETNGNGELIALHLAAFDGNNEITKFLIQQSLQDVHTYSQIGTPLHYAALGGNKEIVVTLLQNGAGIEAPSTDGYKPLHFAADKDHKEVVKALLSKGAQVDARDNQGITPLHLAAEEGKLKVVKVLLNNGADVNARDNSKRTPLYFASKNGYPGIVKALLEKGANFEVKFAGKTPFYDAKDDLVKNILKSTKDLFDSIKSNRQQKVMAAINEEAIIGATDNSGFTLLHWAAKDGYQELVQLLLDKQANPNIKDKNGKTPLDIAQEKLAQDPENENLQTITGLLLSVTNEPFSNLNQQIQSNKKQQKAFTHLSKYIESNFPGSETKAVKQGLYLPSFESRNIKMNGKCAAITRVFSQGLFLGQQVHESFLANLQTSAELYERIAQGKQISKREEQEIFALSRLLSSVEQELTLPASSLPSSLSHIKSYKTLEDLSHYVSELTDDFAIHLVTSNHVVAIYRTGDSYTYFDSNVALVSNLKNVDQLMKIVEKGVKYADYELAEEGFLVEYFDVAQANNALTTAQKEILTKPIQTERHLLSLQDQEYGLIDVNGEKISRVTLYDMGAKLHAEGSAPVLINSEMSSEDLAQNLSSGKIKITAREYLENLKGNKKEVIQDIVQTTSSLPFSGSINEVKDANTIQDLVLSENGQKLNSYELNKILSGRVEQSIKALPYYLEVANTKHWPNRLTNAAGRISMAKGYYDIAHSIRYGDTQGFLLGSGEIGFSLFSQLIEDGVVKVAPQIIKQMKHGIFLTRGFAGLISSPFDIYDLVSSSIDLANSKKGSKEWRDSIAGVTFSGASVVSGVAFTALGKPGVGTVVGLGILIGQGLYSGTSMVIEYKKYKLTTNQEFRLFWHTFALQLPPEDVQYLAARKDVVNKLAEQAWEHLQNNTQVAAYGMGLGEIRFVDDTHSRSKRMIGDMEQSIIGAKLRNDIHIPDHQDLEEAIKELLPKPKEVKVEPSSSSIGMSSPSNKRNGRNLSRIVPVSPSSEAEMLCLPQFTHRDYEYDNSFIGRKPVYTVPHSDFLVPHWDSGYGDSPALYSNSSTAIYHCHNAIIVGRKNDTMENPTMVFDLSLVNGNGLIVSSSKYNNQFNIAQGGAKIYGSNHTSNVFTLTDDNFFGRVSGGTANATNVLDVSQLKSKGLSYENNIVTTQEAQMTAENINHFIGRKAEAEHVDCQNMNNKIVIDSRGGNSGNSDVVSNCRKVIVTGNTKVVSNESDNTFYIKPSAGHAEIRGEGKGFVIFSDTALLQRASNISYSSTNNTLSIEIKGNSGNSGTFTLDVQNYLDKENNHHYLLIDKYGSVIEPIIQSNSTHFNLKAETNLTTRAEVAQRYQEISQVNGNYTVYGVVRDTARNNMIFGSEGSDVIPLTQNVTFAQGNEESDVYSLISCEKANVTINNYDEKKALDILYLPTDSIETNRVEDDLHIATGNVTANIKVENFFRNSSYRHLTIIDKDKNTFLPWPSKQSYVQLVPFFHATKGQYMFLLSAEKVQNNPEVIVDAKLDDIRFYRYGNDLMLMDDQPLIVKVENFYGNQYGNFTLNFRSKEKLSSKQLSELAKIAINYQDEIRSSYYDSFREYRMSSFNSTIHHNQRFVNGSLTTVEPDDKRVGILLLKDPSGIEVSVDNNDLVFFAAQNNATFVIKNWNDTDHRVSMLRFGQEDKSSIEVRKLDKFDLSEVAEIQAVINKAAQSNALDEQLEKLNGKIVNGLKYLFASNGIVNGIDTYSCLGFDSMEDQQEFVAAYSTFYNKEKLKEVLQDNQVVEALRWLIAKGHTNLSLKDHDKEKHLLLKDLDQCFAAKDSFTIENWNHVSVLKFNQTIEVDLSEVSEIQHLISKYGITQLEELSDEEEFKYLLVGMDIRNGIYSCVAEKDTQKIYNPYYYEWLNWGLIKRLIDEKKVDANTKANDGNTILHEAASSGNLDIVKYLVDEKEVDVNSRANDGRTPIHHAAFSGSLDLVRYLVDEKEVDVTAKDNDGKTSLHYAAYSGNLDLVKYLVEEKSVGINTKDNYGNTILHEAASSNNLDLVKYLIDKGADVDAKTNGHWTPLHKAAEKGNEEIVLALLNKGVDVNAKTIGGWTALHWAVSSGNKKTILALLNKRANINARTDSGETALHMAEQQGKREIVDLLNHRNTTEHQRGRRAIKEIPITDDLELFVAQNNATPVMVEEKATSSATRTSSLINDLFGWVKGSIGGLFNSRSALPENNTTQGSLSQIDARVNVDGTILLLDVFIRKVTGKKPISTEGQSISLLEAQGYASSITLGFDTLLKRTARSCGIQDNNSNFNPIEVQSTIVGQIRRNDKLSEISKTLYSSAKKAYPEFKQTDKFLDRLKNNLEEVLAEKEVELLVGKQKPISVDKAKPAIQEDKPNTFLNDTSTSKRLSYAERVRAESSWVKAGVRIG
ncbi:ankyrin repeat domain-containing protein [Wolbachia endosymbiont of Folsomia candida]|uniref:ankyrin repeat domain-containing protein n=1 Tax=Wolbachia endosymbiont of Folsomia candida TaxID=169402 RepID=UPI000B2B1322|nr:ankyrin repeat domain-containing protein [Wolbachia endosymbiont of Folsomia candida]APR97793.1 hypothetical protein ASM33_00325 [Wolbachia endosymbiont of Folsomia candida]